MRWSTRLSPFGSESGAPLPLDGKFPSDWPYDVQTYDWLNDTYAAHINKHFWNLHGLVDQTIDRWMEAKGYTNIAVDCKGDSKCYQWRGTWVGKPMHQHHEETFEATEQKDPVLERSIMLKRMNALRDGELTDTLLQELRRERTEIPSPWEDDPEDFVTENFCR
jgi:hypothetical protein